MDKFLDGIIKKDIYDLCISLQKYNKSLSIDFLKGRYYPTILLKNKQIKKRQKYKTRITKIINSKNRCTARCWGRTKNNVKYNPIQKKWYYGARCTRRKKQSSYCLMHYKQSKTSEGLPHGDYFKDPPHPHFYKYKRKIENRFNITY